MCSQKPLGTFFILILLTLLSGNSDSAPVPARPALELQIGCPFDATVWSFAAHAPRLAVGTATGIQLWDTRTWELIRTISVPRSDPSQSPSALDLSLSPDGLLLAAATAEGNVEVWNAASGVPLRVIGVRASHLMFSPDCTEIVVSGPVAGAWRHGQTTFWNIQTGTQRLRLPEGSGEFAVSSDGRCLALANHASSLKDSAVTLWNTRTGKRMETLADGSGVFAPLSFSPSGRQIVTAGDDPNWKPPSGGPYSEAAYAHSLTLKIWNVGTHKRLRVLPGQSNQFSQGLQWSADGKRIVSSSWGVLVYRANGTRQRQITNMGRATLLSPDGITLYAAGKSGITVLDLRTSLQRTIARRFYGAADVEAALYSPDSRRLASGGSAGVRLWNAQTGAADKFLPFPYLNSLFFLPDSRSLVTSTLQQVKIWDTLTGSVRHTFTNGLPEKGETMSPSLPAFMEGINLLLSPDGKTLLRKPGGGLVRTADVLDADTGTKRAQLLRMEQPLYTAVFSPDSGLLANGNGNGVGQSPPDPPSITVWDLHTGDRLYDFPVTATLAGPAAFSADSRTLAVADWTQIGNGVRAEDIRSFVTLRDMATGQLRLRIAVGTDTVRSLLFSPDSRILAVNHAGQVEFYDTATGKPVGRISLPEENLIALAFSPDGTRIVTEGQNAPSLGQNLMQVWRVSDDRLLVTLIGLVVDSQPTRDWLAFTPDSYYAASAGAKQAIRFRVSGHLLAADQCPAMCRPDIVQRAMQAR